MTVYEGWVNFLGVPGLILRFLGAFDAADVVSMCGGNDGKLWDWWWADVISTRHMNNQG